MRPNKDVNKTASRCQAGSSAGERGHNLQVRRRGAATLLLPRMNNASPTPPSLAGVAGGGVGVVKGTGVVRRVVKEEGQESEWREAKSLIPSSLLCLISYLFLSPFVNDFAPTRPIAVPPASGLRRVRTEGRKEGRR